MKKHGFTLIEIIFYFTIVSTLLLAGMTFAIQILNVTSLSNNIHELEANRDFILQKIVDTVQVADSVDATNSVFNSDTGTLSLTMLTGTPSPTKFYLLNGKVYIKEGSSAAVQLSADTVTFSKLRFQRVTASKTPDQIVIDGTLSAASPDIANLQKDFSFHTAVSIRSL